MQGHGGSYVMGNPHGRTKEPREKPWAHPEAHHAIMFVDIPLLGGVRGGCVQVEMIVCSQKALLGFVVLGACDLKGWASALL